jgi:CDP-diacylglycerol--glycerol-3-phosphate 3-phosphatidyltransferase
MVDFLVFNLSVSGLLFFVVRQIALGLARRDPEWLGGRGKIGVPNYISITRFSMAPIVPYIYIVRPFEEASYIVAGALAIVLVLTDILDGRIARRMGAKTKFGEMFDALADKAIQVATIVGIIVASASKMVVRDVILLTIVLLRDCAFLIWYIWKRRVIAAGPVDKLRAIALSVWIFAAVIKFVVPADWLSIVGFVGLSLSAVLSPISIFAGLQRANGRS